MGPDPLTNLYFHSKKIDQIKDHIAENSNKIDNELISDVSIPAELEKISNDLNSISRKARTRRGAAHTDLILIVITALASLGIVRRMKGG